MTARASLPYWHIDAFADHPFAGNQAAVVIVADWPADDTMRAIAAENMFAETAFLKADASQDADWELRWFTPTSEVQMCGHATLASGHAMLGANGGDRVRFRTRKAGVLEVSREGAGYALSLPSSRVEQRAMPDILAALGIDAPCFDVVEGVEQTTIVLLDDEAAVRAVIPDMAALGAIDRMVICTAPGAQTDVVSRVFVPAWGVPEDPVTGSAHSVLTPFWCDRLGRESFTAFQASTRGGHMTCRRAGDRAILSGNCVTIVKGRFYPAG
ncbi:PhzF family phenazine biosynthesis isomerase [Erythrobacter arachoides]|uniref:PhzF family phenazine biosynthesis isomerase n=1 Tax=Aurantiacibacter arachoides TaxID=1850444 RepID=A0A845A6Z5_9SPHN|nr:PhzF family phenazine biosynthesis protein [Aurantiacibacter arachoides]MXO94697.1 PhzF family phenazine biosynthesis isomerase [Aurantiacibacter arachoides]GGD61397.1 putative isomerase [Aurantiacibacter arachoides]